MEEAERSTVPVRHGFPNPKYQRVAALIGDLAEYRELAVKIRAEAKKLGKNYTFAQLKANCSDQGIKETLKALVDKNKSVPDSAPVLGAPPAPLVLYGMFGKGVKIVDVGSGNCMKIRRFTGELKITAVDPNLRNESGHVIKTFKKSFMDWFVDLKPPGQDLIFTSWMSLTQLTPQEEEIIMQHDGLHLIPDHDTLIDVGIARCSGEQVEVRTISGGFTDRRLTIGGQSIASGYLLAPSYKEREIEVELGEIVSSSLPNEAPPQPGARPAGFYDLDFSDVTPKFDGVFKELELHEGRAFLTGRDGTYVQGTTNVQFHLCLHLEEMGGVYVLLRVVQYRGYVPPHYGGGLRFFVSKVKMKINGKAVIAPPKWNGMDMKEVQVMWYDTGQAYYHKLPIDGIISRVEGSDFYCKYMWTVDLRPRDFPNVTKALNEAGFSLDAQDRREGMYEYAMQRNGSCVVLRPLKPRVDKKIATTVDTVVFLVERPTLAETGALAETMVHV